MPKAPEDWSSPKPGGVFLPPSRKYVQLTNGSWRAGATHAQQPPRLLKYQRLASQDGFLSLSGSAGQSYDIQVSFDFKQWSTWRTVSGGDSEQLFAFPPATNQLFVITDPVTRFVQNRFYRTVQTDTNALTEGPLRYWPERNARVDRFGR